jgi:hypothetical protein
METNMRKQHSSSFSTIAAAAGLAAVLSYGAAQAIEVRDLKGFEALFGRYAPGGDCARQPQIVVEAAGFTFEVAGAREKVTNPEYAASYGGNFYQGITQWFLPFRSAQGYPILLAFNDGEKRGVLSISAQDEGWRGGPPLGPRNQALVEGSPYARCM